MPDGTEWIVTIAGDGGRLVYGSGVLAMIFVGLRYVTMRSRTRLCFRLGPVDWNFSRSWASTITGAGAALGTLLSAQILAADAKPVPRETLAGLNVLFGALIVMAPLVFNALAAAVEVADPQKGPSYQGHVGGFLLTSVITLCAVVGQLGTLAVSFHELKPGAMPGWVSWFFTVVAGLAIVMVAKYAWSTMAAIMLAAKPPPRNGSVPGRAENVTPWALL